MANNVQVQRVDEVRGALEKLKGQMAMALPKHLTPDRLVRVAMTAVQSTPKLLECDRTSFYAAIMTCAQLGLEPDGVLGQAYLVPFAGKVQFIPGYKGLLTLARNSGEIQSIQAHEVCRGDKFVYRYGLNEELEHVPAEGERGEVTHFYAYAKFKDGGYVFEVLTRAQVETIRDRSQGYQSAKKWAKNGVINSPWVEHFVEMGRKTAIRRLAKYLPMSVQRAASIEDAVDRGYAASIDTYGEIALDAPEGKGLLIQGGGEEVTDSGADKATSKLDGFAGDDAGEAVSEGVTDSDEPEAEQVDPPPRKQQQGRKAANPAPAQEAGDDELFGSAA